MGKALVVGTRSGSGEALAATKQTAAAALSLAQENIVRDAIEASHAPRLRIRMGSLRRLVRGPIQGHRSLPAAPETVAAYLAERAHKRASARVDPTDSPGPRRSRRARLRARLWPKHRRPMGVRTDARSLRTG